MHHAGRCICRYGKYLNSGGMQKICPAPVGDGTMLVPAGWIDFMGACPDTCYENCNYNINGVSATFNDPAYTNGSNYGTSLIGNRSVAFARAAMDAGWPFFIYVASHAPHGPATPAPWYAGLYDDVSAPRTPSFNVTARDKHWLVATQAPLTHDYIAKAIDPFFKNRLRSLQSVDDIIQTAYSTVLAAGQIDRTFFIFSSEQESPSPNTHTHAHTTSNATTPPTMVVRCRRG